LFSGGASGGVPSRPFVFGWCIGWGTLSGVPWLLAMLCVIGQRAAAEDTARAEAAFEEGKRLYHDEPFEAAAAAFRGPANRAYFYRRYCLFK
jgi:hypothetical protein